MEQTESPARLARYCLGGTMERSPEPGKDEAQQVEDKLTCDIDSGLDQVNGKANIQ